MRAKWTETTLGEVVSAQPGYAFNSDLFSETIGTPLIRIRDLKKQTRTETKYTGEFDPQYRVTSGDFLIGMDGEFRCYEWLGEDALLNQRVCRLQNFDLKRVVPRIVYLLMNSHLQNIERATSFTTVKHISSKQIENIVVWLPGLREQQRIVDVFIAVDAYIAALQQQVADARAARNAVLHELLTAGGADWTETTLGEVALVMNGSTPSTRVADYWGGEIPWATTTELTTYDGGHVASSGRRITKAAITKGGARVVGQGATLLGTTATIGTVAFTLNALSFNQQISALLPKTESLQGEFLFLWARNNRVQFENLSAGTSFKRISTTNLRNLIMLLPPVSVQRAIVDIVLAMDKVIQATDKAVMSAKQLRAGLIDSLLSGDHEIPESYDRLLGAA